MVFVSFYHHVVGPARRTPSQGPPGDDYWGCIHCSDLRCGVVAGSPNVPRGSPRRAGLCRDRLPTCKASDTRFSPVIICPCRSSACWCWWPASVWSCSASANWNDPALSVFEASFPVVTLNDYLFVSGLLFAIGFAGCDAAAQYPDHFHVPGIDAQRCKPLRSWRFRVLTSRRRARRTTTPRCSCFSSSPSQRPRSPSGWLSSWRFTGRGKPVQVSDINKLQF